MNWRAHPILRPPTDAEMAQMEPAELVRLHGLYHSAIANSERDPYRYGFVLENWRKADVLLSQHDAVVALGGNRCLRGDTLIYNPALGTETRIDAIKGKHHVLAWNGTKLVCTEAEEPFTKPAGQMVEIVLSTGESFVAAKEHLVLGADGAWLSCGSLRQSSALFRPRSISGTSRQGQLRDGGHWSEIPSSSQCDCRCESRLCDGPLLSDQDSAPGIFPSLGDAPTRISPSDRTLHGPSPRASGSSQGTLDVLDRTPSRSHGEPRRARPANSDALPQPAAPCVDIESGASCTPCKSASPSPAGQASSPASSRSTDASGHLQYANGFRPQDILSRYEVAYVTEVREAGIEVKWDMTVPAYGNYWAAGAVHHNSAKTCFGAWESIRCAMENEGSLIVCFAQNAELSVLVQQSAVFNALPVEFKQKMLGQDEYVSYTKQNGFAGNSLILPNGSRILFKTYAQFQQNQTVLEGLELGSYSPKLVNLGAWCDEYLGGPELIDTLAFRLATRNAKMLLTFTPIDGYSETIRQFLDGAKTIETKQAELLNNRPVPYIQKCKDRDAAIIYLHTKDNPFSGYERVAKEALAKGDEAWVLCRVYGIPTKSISSKFPSFSREVNVVKHEMIPKAGVTRYMVLDPAGRKKWFMVWIAVDATDTWWVYREWPDVGLGDWAEWRNGKWAPGEAAKRDGNVEGVEQYVRLITDLEREDALEAGEPEKFEVFERLIDPRLGAAKYQGAKGVSTSMDDLADAGLTFLPAPGLEIDDGLQALHNQMAYDRKRPIDGSNRPRFYISERCENIIRAIQEYTGDGGKDEAWKDPLDVIRYAAIADIRYINPKAFSAKQTGRGGY